MAARPIEQRTEKQLKALRYTNGLWRLKGIRGLIMTGYYSNILQETTTKLILDALDMEEKRWEELWAREGVNIGKSKKRRG